MTPRSRAVSILFTGTATATPCRTGSRWRTAPVWTRSTIFLRIDSAGAVYVDAWSPECPGGGENIGRFSPELWLPSAVEITAQ